MHIKLPISFVAGYCYLPIPQHLSSHLSFFGEKHTRGLTPDCFCSPGREKADHGSLPTPRPQAHMCPVWCMSLAPLRSSACHKCSGSHAPVSGQGPHADVVAVVWGAVPHLLFRCLLSLSLSCLLPLLCFIFVWFSFMWGWVGFGNSPLIWR